MKTRTQITLMGTLLTAGTSICVCTMLWFQSRQIRADVGGLHASVAHLREDTTSELERVMRSDLEQTTGLLWRMVQASDLRTATQLEHGLNVARSVLGGLGEVSLSHETAAWTVVNQFTRTSSEAELPVLVAGDTSFPRNTDRAVPSPLVDEVQASVAQHCTLFQRINDAGDMLRICTTVIGNNGSRAVGTYIPRINPDGSENPVVKKVLSGETFHGRAFVVNEWHQAAYDPIWDAKRERIIGMLYVGVSMTSINEQLNAAMKETVLGKTGGVFVLGATGDVRGQFLVSKQGRRDGEKAWDVTDAKGVRVIEEIITRAAAGNGDEMVLLESEGLGDPTDQSGTQVIAARLYKPWNWVIGSAVLKDEFLEGRRAIDASTAQILGVVEGATGKLSRTAISVLITGAFAVGLAWLIGRRIATGISSPLEEGVRFAGALAAGDLTRRIEQRGSAETRQLAHALNQMAAGLHETMGEVLRNVRTVAASVTNLAEISQQVSVNSEETSQQARSVAEAAQDVSTNVSSVAAASEEMSATIAEIAKQTSHASVISQNAARRASDATSRITRLDESSRCIGEVVKTISAIAQQTNLLALNATIESARAGEAGKGFSVVAGEVKSLAGQTAKATEDIRQRISDIQLEVAAATEAVRAITQVIDDISKSGTVVATSSEEQVATMQEISSNSSRASHGSSEIAVNIGRVSEVSRSSTEAAASAAASTQELSRLATDLQQLVTRFRLDGSNEAPSAPRPEAKAPPTPKARRWTRFFRVRMKTRAPAA